MAALYNVFVNFVGKLLKTNNNVLTIPLLGGYKLSRHRTRRGTVTIVLPVALLSTNVCLCGSCMGLDSSCVCLPAKLLNTIVTAFLLGGLSGI